MPKGRPSPPAQPGQPGHPRSSGQPAQPALGRWLLLIYRVPQEPAGRRTYVWRQLRQLGAVYLQQAAAILPDLPERGVRAGLEALADRIREFEGEASLLETTSPTAEWERDLIARFNQARDSEYDEVVENVERFEDEVKRETRKKKFTFAELEDADADWDKIVRLQQRIVDRDFFNAPGCATAESAIERGRRALETFTEAVYRHEGVATAGNGAADPGPAANGYSRSTTSR